MKLKSGIVVFEWDTGNLNKNRRKHGVTPEEAESVFFEANAYTFPDVRHSEHEERWVLLGKSERDRMLFIVFTQRDKKIRIISARRMHKKEVEKYEKITQSAEV